jgi:hypothetical protein
LEDAHDFGELMVTTASFHQGGNDLSLFGGELTNPAGTDYLLFLAERSIRRVSLLTSYELRLEVRILLEKIPGLRFHLL